MAENKTKEDELSYQIIKAALEVHSTLGGPGLLESVYEEALVWELKNMDLTVERQKRLPVIYKGKPLAESLFVDVMVNNLVIIECKATEDYNTLYEAQTLTYLRLTGLKLGLVINFGQRFLRNGIKRVVNSL